MTEDLIYTATMAKIYTSQGDYSKAVRIYRHLIERDPDNTELLRALGEVEKNIIAGSTGEFGRLLGRWIDLMLNYHNLRKLRRLGSAGR